MKRVFDPLRLDVAAFAAEGAALQGEWPLALLPRLAEVNVGEAPQPAPVEWQAEGEQRGRRAGQPELWLHMEASAQVRLHCQRCLQPMAVPLQAERSFRFVQDEAEAEAQDADSEEDVLALTRTLDLRTLVEDELLLELPLVPRHEVCPEPLPWQPPEADDEAGAAEETPHPFAKLAALKRGGGSSGGGEPSH